MKIVSLTSGGIDSAVLLYHLQEAGHTVIPMLIDYGQRNRQELDAAELLCEIAEAEPTRVNLTAIQSLFGENSQTSGAVDVPVCSSSDPASKLTVVPNRNMVMLSIAAAHALARGAEAVAFGAQAGGAAFYPDTREVFCRAMSVALLLCDDPGVDLLYPFAGWTKPQVLQRGAELGVPFEATYTCYVGRPVQCGTCVACVKRKEAFVAAGIDDFTTYEYA